MSRYTRRDALRAGLGAAGLSLAGCLAAPTGDDGGGESDETTTATETPEATGTTTAGRPTLELSRVPAADVTADASVVVFSPTLRGWLERATDAGAVDLPDDANSRLSIERAEYVRYGGDYYDLSTETVRSESKYELALDPNEGTVEPDAAVVSFENLTKARQKVVRNARRDEATVGFHEAYDGRYDFAGEYDYVEYEGRYYGLSLNREDRSGKHRVLRIEEVEASTIEESATVFELEYVELPDEDRSTVATAMRTGSATAAELSTILIETIERVDYVAGPSAIYAATVEDRVKA